MSLACLILFVVVFIYSVVTSKSRVKTFLYTLGAVAVALLLCVVLSLVDKNIGVDRLGAIGIIVGSLVGIGVAVIHARRSRAVAA